MPIRMSTPPRSQRIPRTRTTLARMAVNAALAGAWAALLLALLPFFLNADVPLTLRNYGLLAWPLVLFYAPVSGLIWALLAGVVRLFAAFRVRVPWLGFRPFWRFLVADLWVLTLLYGVNLRQGRDYLPASMTTILLGATILLGVVTLMLTVDALWRGLGRRRPRPRAALVAMLLLTAGLFALRARVHPLVPPPSASEFQPPAPTRGVLLLGLEGASPGDFLAMVADGRLPNLQEFLREGGSAPLSSPRPARARAAWATVRTGLVPAAHGLVSDRHLLPPGGRPLFRLPPAGVLLDLPAALGLVRLEVGENTTRATPTIAGILERCGYSVIDLGWPGSAAEKPRSRAGEPLPDALVPHVDALRRHLAVARNADDGGPLAQVLAQALAADLSVGRAALAAAATVAEEGAAPALLVRFTGLDRVGRAFLRYQRPNRFGNVTDDELDRYGAVLPDYYRFMDAWLGILRLAAGEGSRLLVISPYGIEPVSLMTRAGNALRGRWFDAGTDRGRAPGVLLAAGPGFRQDARLESARAEDVLPTLLYLLDLPVGRDMDGQPLPRFASEQFADEHAVSAVPSWETVTVIPPVLVW
jgi:hypothetical protein